MLNDCQAIFSNQQYGDCMGTNWKPLLSLFGGFIAIGHSKNPPLIQPSKHILTLCYPDNHCVLYWLN